MKKMKIAHVTWSLGTGGIETMLVDIINEQVKNAEVILFIINDVIDNAVLSNIDHRVKIKCCKRIPKGYSIIPIIKLNLLMLEEHPNIVHCHHDKIESMIFIPFKKVRTVHNTHSDIKSLKNYNQVFCISKGVKYYIDSHGYHKGLIVYNGIHPERIKSAKAGIFSKDKKHFISIGRLHPDKGQALIVEAFDKLVHQQGIKNIEIDLIGDGQSRSYIESLIEKRGLKQYIHLMGNKPRDYFYPLLCEYDLFILSSITEGFGLSLAEACAAKVPVITCDLEGPLEVVDGGRLGRVFKTGDVCSLIKQIKDYLSRGRDESQIEEAFQYVYSHFDVSRTAKLYMEYYNSVIL